MSGGAEAARASRAAIGAAAAILHREVMAAPAARHRRAVAGDGRLRRAPTGALVIFKANIIASSATILHRTIFAGGW